MLLCNAWPARGPEDRRENDMLQPKALAVISEVRKAILGKDTVVCKVLMAILARGHILLEDNPGVGKTTLALAFSKAMALDYRRMQFIFEILHIFQLVIQRRDPSACHQLDLTRTQTQVIPRSDDHGIHPVGDDSSPDFLGMSQAATIERLRDIVYHTKIGMSACFGNNRPTRINTRSRQCSLIDRPFQSEYRSPRIPDRRKTPQKSSSRLPLRLSAVYKKHERSTNLPSY